MGGRRLRLWHVDVREGTAKVVECEDSVEEFHRLVDCDTFDITTRYVEGREFCFIVDDEGLLKDPSTIRISAIDANGRAALVGNLLVAARDEEEFGELRSLSELEISILRRHTGLYLVRGQRDSESYNTVAINGLRYAPPMSIWRDEGGTVEAW